MQGMQEFKSITDYPVIGTIDAKDLSKYNDYIATAIQASRDIARQSFQLRNEVIRFDGDLKLQRG